jgi:hypothetical protein
MFLDSLDQLSYNESNPSCSLGSSEIEVLKYPVLYGLLHQRFCQVRFVFLLACFCTGCLKNWIAKAYCTRGLVQVKVDQI